MPEITITVQFNMKDCKRFILIIPFLLISGILFGQSLRVPSPGYKNSAGTAISSGVFIDKPAWFLGWGVDYSRVIGAKWIILGGMAYDQEHNTKPKENEFKVVHSLSPNIAVGYILTPKLAMGIGIGKGLFDTDNPGQELKFTTSGNVTIGLLGSFTVYSKNRHGLDISWGLERGLITPETDVTIEFGYSYSF
jgi:hypothetical protein